MSLTYFGDGKGQPTSLRGRQPQTVGPNVKNAPLIKPTQSGKLIDYTFKYDCNDLTDFDKEVHS